MDIYYAYVLHVLQHNNSIDHLSVAGYVNELFQCLYKYNKNNQIPPLDDKKPRTLASTGPAYTMLNAVAEEMVKRLRGELAKPHYIEKPADTVVKLSVTRQKQPRQSKKQPSDSLAMVETPATSLAKQHTIRPRSQ